MFKKLINSIKLHIFCKLLNELCWSRDSCIGCPAYSLDPSDIHGASCAQAHIIDQAENKWGSKDTLRTGWLRNGRATLTRHCCEFIRALHEMVNKGIKKRESDVTDKEG